MKVKVFTAGGTIDKIYFDAKSQYQVGSPSVESILNEAGVTFNYEIESLLRKDSLDLTDEDREFIRKKVSSENCEKILITHGTDTIVETAKILSTIQGKTIVMTGALAPAHLKNSDASFNVGFACASLFCLSHGVYITINGKIFNPFAVKKNLKINKFESIE